MELTRRVLLQTPRSSRFDHYSALPDYVGLPGVQKLELHSSDEPRSRFNIVEFAPGSGVTVHESPSVNYWIVIEGEIDSIVDGHEPVTLGAGDCCIQEGVAHGWIVRGPERAVLLAVVIPHVQSTDGQA